MAAMSEAAALMPDHRDSTEGTFTSKKQVLMHEHPVLGSYRLPRDTGASWRRYLLEMCVVRAPTAGLLSVIFTLQPAFQLMLHV